jgi:PKD repeat protein
MDSALNSTADDFGIVADSTGESGYFSTNRRKTDDIFSFRTEKMEFGPCEKMKVNQYCFTFYDENQLIDSGSALYQWDFGDGIKVMGIEVEHCFPGPGQYSVILNITDKLTGKPIAEEVTYKVDLEDAEQAYINSDSVGIVNQFISFDALQSNLKDFKISGYYWNFGDGFVPGPARLNHAFYKEGEYTVLLGLIGEKEETGLVPKTCVKKIIKINKQPE